MYGRFRKCVIFFFKGVLDVFKVNFEIYIKIKSLL